MDLVCYLLLIQSNANTSNSGDILGTSSMFRCQVVK